MEELIKSMLPTGIARYPLLIIIVVIYLYPHVRSIWLELKHKIFALDTAKRQLEIVKLRCEIEGLKKAQGISESFLDSCLKDCVGGLMESANHSDSRITLSRLHAFTLGFSGCIAATLAWIGLVS